ncbi:MAG: tyrosine--tRNA ligase [Candidatus Lokiarchaeota archaeon]|nr:tyrosine--tRNA ligase [Candidatus Lokiarchaeota archaeon]
MTLSLDEKIEILKEVGKEIIEENELRDMLKWKVENKKDIIAYDGFEPSGNIHIAQGLLRAINVNKLTKVGIKFKFLIADWHAAANQKFGGNLDVIKKVGDFFIEVWKVCDMDLSKVEFVYASDLVKDPKYWELVLKIAINSTLNRIIRCTQIMGRNESDALTASQILYPLMQAADIFYLNVDICQLGLDQRKVNMLAREVSKIFNLPKPVSIHHHMLMGLTPPPETDLTGMDRAIHLKMSKSNPDSAIFMLDTLEDITRKIKKAYCPEKQINENPIIEYCKYIIFERIDTFQIERPEKFGGNLEYSSYSDMEKDYSQGKIHPLDLKKTVIKYLNQLLEPIREHFKKDQKAKQLYSFVLNEYKKYKAGNN